MLRQILSPLLIALVFFGCAQKPEERQLKEKDKNLTIQLEATAFAHQIRTISSISGKVKAIDKQVGYYVKKDDPIFSIDKDLIQKEVLRLEEEIKNDERNLRRYKTTTYSGSNPSIIQLARMNLEKVAALHAQGYTSDEKFLQAKENYANALFTDNERRSTTQTRTQDKSSDLSEKKLELYKLKQRLKNTTVKATMEGYIYQLDLFEGKLLTEGEKVGEIVDISKVRVRAGLATGLLPFVKKAKQVEITFLTTPPYRVTVPIEKIVPVIDPEFGRIAVDFLVENNDFLIQPGTKAIAIIPLEKNEQEEVKDRFLIDEKKNKSNVLEIRSSN